MSLKKLFKSFKFLNLILSICLIFLPLTSFSADIGCLLLESIIEHTIGASIHIASEKLAGKTFNLEDLITKYNDKIRAQIANKNAEIPTSLVVEEFQKSVQTSTQRYEQFRQDFKNEIQKNIITNSLALDSIRQYNQSIANPIANYKLPNGLQVNISSVEDINMPRGAVGSYEEAMYNVAKNIILLRETEQILNFVDDYFHLILETVDTSKPGYARLTSFNQLVQNVQNLPSKYSFKPILVETVEKLGYCFCNKNGDFNFSTGGTTLAPMLCNQLRKLEKDQDFIDLINRAPYTHKKYNFITESKAGWLTFLKQKEKLTLDYYGVLQKFNSKSDNFNQVTMDEKFNPSSTGHKEYSEKIDLKVLQANKNNNNFVKTLKFLKEENIPAAKMSLEKLKDVNNKHYKALERQYKSLVYNQYGIKKEFENDPAWKNLSAQDLKEIQYSQKAQEVVNQEFLNRKILKEKLAQQFAISASRQQSKKVSNALYYINSIDKSQNFSSTAKSEFLVTLATQDKEILDTFFVSNGLVKNRGIVEQKELYNALKENLDWEIPNQNCNQLHVEVNENYHQENPLLKSHIITKDFEKISTTFAGFFLAMQGLSKNKEVKSKLKKKIHTKDIKYKNKDKEHILDQDKHGFNDPGQDPEEWWKKILEEVKKAYNNGHLKLNSKNYWEIRTPQNKNPNFGDLVIRGTIVDGFIRLGTAFLEIKR